MEIELIPIDELRKDKQDSIVDIENCEHAISMGILRYSGGLVSERLRINKEILTKIDIELKRRGD